MHVLGIARAIVVAAALVSPAALSAAEPSAMPAAAEKPFVDKASADIGKLYPTVADAEKAGYRRYTDEDKSGSISYENGQWTSDDADHPSQLWYSAGGKLLGADYSVPYTADRPHLFGIDPARWLEFHAHVHYALVGPDGKLTYDGTGNKKITAAGGDPADPTAANLVAAGITKTPSDVKFVFEFPHIWDLEVWLIPNSNGAFAELNPAVKPVHPSGDDM